MGIKLAVQQAGQAGADVTFGQNSLDYYEHLMKRDGSYQHMWFIVFAPQIMPSFPFSAGVIIYVPQIMPSIPGAERLRGEGLRLRLPVRAQEPEDLATRLHNRKNRKIVVYQHVCTA